MLKFIIKRSRNFFQGINDRIFIGYKLNESHKLDSIINPFEFGKSCNHLNSLQYITELFCNHRFDLLGSGWVNNTYTSNSIGFEGVLYTNKFNNIRIDEDGDWLKEILFSRHIKDSKKIWGLVDSKSYIPIDWQRDIKSGYRWSNKTWYKDCLNVVGRIKGVDIKVPWELSRLQHLPQMAISALCDEGKSNKLTREFRNQVLDFIATNPLKFGVNWSCTMDVSIRAVNLLIAFDMFMQIDKANIIDKDFIKVFSNYIYQHGKFIIKNLEWNAQKRTNHYLSNIGGLVFISTYLEGSKQIDTWLAFSVQELVKEFEFQFNEDGSNWEGSTSYHRLSMEIVLFSTALILGLKKSKKNALSNYNIKYWKGKVRLNSPKHQVWYKIGNHVFPEWYWEKLYKAGRFTDDISKQNGEICQVGDNDNGRFIKLTPCGTLFKVGDICDNYKNLHGYRNYLKQKKIYDSFFWDENNINHQSLLGLFSGIFNEEIFTKHKLKYSFENGIIKMLSKGKNTQLNKNKLIPNVIDKNFWKNKKLQFNQNSILYEEEKGDQCLTKGLTFVAYQDFGIFIFKSKRLYLAINGRNSKGEKMPHAHDDHMSFELQIDKKNIFVDPGSYVYTSDIHNRNYYRSNIAHNGIRVDDSDQVYYNEGVAGLFRLVDKAKCNSVELRKNSITLIMEYSSINILRTFTITENRVLLNTSCNKIFTENFKEKTLFSPGYGKQLDIYE
ncbi:MAG: heparinase II/III family protein [Bacteroidales bacterium]|nr:heparinase II/III family protein [Bacteroidales bacterium]